MRAAYALSLILFFAAIVGADEKTTADIAYAKAKACIAVTKITGSPLAGCAMLETREAEEKASAIVTKALEKKVPAPLPQGPLFLEGGRLMIEGEKVWQRNANGSYTLSACRYENGQVICPLKQQK
jgi:hypothetical protein